MAVFFFFKFSPKKWGGGGTGLLAPPYFYGPAHGRLTKTPENKGICLYTSQQTCSQVFHCDARCAKCFDSCLIKVYVVNLVTLYFTAWNINKHSYIVGYLATEIIKKSAMATSQTCLGYMPKEICPLNDFLPEIVLKFQNNLQHKRQDDN